MSRYNKNQTLYVYKDANQNFVNNKKNGNA